MRYIIKNAKFHSDT